MALEDYERDMQRCSRCSYCKWIPLAHVNSSRFARGCPSVEYNKFHSYSGGGRMIAALSLLEGRSGYSDRLLDVAYSCQVCGSCDVSCKICRYDMEPLKTNLELRAKLVEDGQLLPAHRILVDGLCKEDNMMMKPKSERGRWAEGLGVKNLTTEQAEVVFHAGCRLSYDGELWKVSRTAVTLLKDAGVNVGILGEDENCCGCRAYDMGYRREFTKYGEKNIEAWRSAGVKTVVTSCSYCYYGFKRLYPEISKKKKMVEVLHLTEYLARLIKEGVIKLTQEIPMKVTYHDPCHLGRLGEYIPWRGTEKKMRNQMIIHVPRKVLSRGAQGVYDPPRKVLRNIPGLELVEMERIREYSWCCGAGGGVKEAYPGFALWTAQERLDEAKTTGAEAIVTACPWCERNFLDAADRNGQKMKVYDIVELVRQSM